MLDKCLSFLSEIFIKTHVLASSVNNCLYLCCLFVADNLKPVSPEACISSSLTFTCTDLDNTDPSRTMLFYVNNDKVPPLAVTHNGSTVASFTMTNISASDSNANVICGYETSDDFDLKSATILSVFSKSVSKYSHVFTFSFSSSFRHLVNRHFAQILCDKTCIHAQHV